MNQSRAIVKVTVRLSAHALQRIEIYMLPQNDACLLLKSRAWHHWLSGLFMDCTCTSIRQQEAVPSYILRVTMNETKFPQDYHALELFEAEWHINRLLNEEAGDCYSTVTLINELNNSPSKINLRMRTSSHQRKLAV
ncbi:unnamed protein product [Dicrocoelium dendriticum]|nr:unnamed protein product [Dicrocoelium dendriticum]